MIVDNNNKYFLKKDITKNLRFSKPIEENITFNCAESYHSECFYLVAKFACRQF